MKTVILASCVVATLIAAAVAVSKDRRDIVATIVDSDVRFFQHLHIASSHVLRRSVFEGEEDPRHSAAFSVPVSAFNRTWSLSLQPAIGLFGPNAKWGTGEPLTHDGYYQGHVDGDASSFAHVYVSKGGDVTGFFTESDLLKSERYYIRPTPKTLQSDRQGHVIFRSSDIVSDDNMKYMGKLSGPPCASNTTRDRRLVAGPYVASRNVCSFAIYIDQSFITRFGTGPSVTIALERFAGMQAIFENAGQLSSTSGVTVGVLKQYIEFLDYGGSGTALSVATESRLADANDAEKYLEEFSKTDWNPYCLAHAFTYKEFEGTLGLAWTAFPDSEGLNGGICQARYNDPGQGSQMSLNSAFHTQLNFGQQQSGEQSLLVMAHEVAHNYGSGHDPSEVPANGVYLMYPYANSGTDPNNDKLSALSKKEIADATVDRGSCFVESAFPSCGNGLIEENITTGGAYEEDCDGGPSGSKCCEIASGASAVCTGTASFKDSSYECSPANPLKGACCNSSTCMFKNLTAPCSDESSCKLPGQCDANNNCPAGANKPDDQACEVGVLLGQGVVGSRLCQSGQCTKSLCALLDKENCSELDGEDACEIQCMDGGECKKLSDIAFSETLLVSDGHSGTTSITIAQGSDKLHKPAGALCSFEAGQPSSGICDKNFVCQKADGEEDSLAELRAQYAKYQRLFTDWANEETAGIPNYGWLIIGGVLLITMCCLGCYFANRPAIDKYRKQRSIRRKSQGGGGSKPGGSREAAF
eukprot:m.452241 g.452241  ORF g.452241 m.452241 type:complete len:755 (+) comp21537_c0_seq1:181-2445(+)